MLDNLHLANSSRYAGEYGVTLGIVGSNGKITAEDRARFRM